MDIKKWERFLLNERPIGIDRLAYILTDLVNEENITYDMNGNEEHFLVNRGYKKRVVDIVLTLARGINKKDISSNIRGEFETDPFLQLKASFLKQYSGYIDDHYLTEDNNYASAFAQNFPEVVPHIAIQYLADAFDTITYLPPSLIEYLDNESKSCQELPQPQSPQFRNINLDEFPLIRDVIAMLEQGKSKDEIADYLCSRGVTRTNAGLLLHDNPYNVSDDALKKSTDRLRNKNN